MLDLEIRFKVTRPSDSVGFGEIVFTRSLDHTIRLPLASPNSPVIHSIYVIHQFGSFSSSSSLKAGRSTNSTHQWTMLALVYSSHRLKLEDEIGATASRFPLEASLSRAALKFKDKDLGKAWTYKSMRLGGEATVLVEVWKGGQWSGRYSRETRGDAVFSISAVNSVINGHKVVTYAWIEENEELLSVGPVETESVAPVSNGADRYSSLGRLWSAGKLFDVMPCPSSPSLNAIYCALLSSPFSSLAKKPYWFDKNPFSGCKFSQIRWFPVNWGSNFAVSSRKTPVLVFLAAENHHISTVSSSSLLRFAGSVAPIFCYLVSGMQTMEAGLCSARTPSSQEESGDEELSVLPRHTKVIVTGNNRTKSVLVGLQGVVKKAVGLGGWHWLVLKNGVEVKLQRNALSVLEAPTGNEDDDDDIDCDNSFCSSSDMGDKDVDYSSLEFHKPTKPRVRHTRPWTSSAKSNGRGNHRDTHTNGHKPQMRLNLAKLGTPALWRYWRHFNLVNINPNPTKEQLIHGVQNHLLSQQLDEMQVIVGFIHTAKRLKTLYS
ncbi:unnamed protein product [Musa acuminata var. zebrina]